MKIWERFISSHGFQRTKMNIYDYRWLIYIYLFGWLIFLYLFVWFPPKSGEEPWLDKRFGDGFTQNFSASFFWDLIAFLFLGFLATFISTALSKKAPEDYTFRERVGALANNEKVLRDNSLMTFLTSHISKLLVYNSKFAMEIAVTDSEDSISAFRVHTKIEQIITNMCKDNTYVSTEFKTRVLADYQVINKPNFVTHDYIYNTKTNVTIDRNIDANREFIDEYKEIMNITIPKNEEIGYKVWYSVWNKCCGDISDNKEWFINFSRRYSNECKITFKNNLPSRRNIYLQFKIKNNVFDNSGIEEKENRKNILVKPNEPFNFVLKKKLLPLDQIMVYFSYERV